MRPAVAVRDRLIHEIHDLPLPRLLKFGFTRPVASLNAVCISETAVVRVEGVGDLYVAENACPIICWDVAKVPVGDTVREKPVKAVAPMGLTPMLPAADSLVSASAISEGWTPTDRRRRDSRNPCFSEDGKIASSGQIDRRGTNSDCAVGNGLRTSVTD